MIKENRIAYGVRVKLNQEFKEKCLGDKYLKDEKVLFIADVKPSNDSLGSYVHIRGGSLINSGYAYLNELDLEFEVPEKPLYELYNDLTHSMNINEILEKHTWGGEISINDAKQAIKEIVEKTLEIAAENARTKVLPLEPHKFAPTVIVDKESITNTINQIKF